MSWFVLDVEADGPCAGLNSLVSFACIKVDRELDTYFEGTARPISEIYDPVALAVSGCSRELHETYPDPAITFKNFDTWLKSVNHGKKMTFLSDNPAFDFSFINYYFWRFTGNNPFGYSARRIGDLYSGMKNNASMSGGWRELRKTDHTHEPLQDAMGVAEALLEMERHGLKIPGLHGRKKVLELAFD